MANISIASVADLKKFVNNNSLPNGNLDLVAVARLCGARAKPLRGYLSDPKSLLYSHLKSKNFFPLSFISVGIPVSVLAIVLRYFAKYDVYPRNSAKKILALKGVSDYLDTLIGESVSDNIIYIDPGESLSPEQFRDMREAFYKDITRAKPKPNQKQA